MANTKHDWLDATPLEDGIWLDMLVDGELSAEQRSRYLVHLKDGDKWEAVAHAFLDEQVLADCVELPVAERSSEPPLEVKPRRSLWLSLAAMAACLLLGGFLGHLIQQPNQSSDDSLAHAFDGKDSPDVTEVEPSLTVLASTAVPLPALFQASDSLEEAVFYADYTVPQFLLDALVIAGHKVELDQEFSGYTQSLSDPAAVPINVIRIKKYGALLASGEATAAPIQ